VPASMTRRARENEAEADRDARQPAAGLQGHREHSQALANPYQNILGSLSARDQRLLDRLPLMPPGVVPRPQWLRSVARLTCNWLGMQPLPRLARAVIHADKLSLLDEIAYTISFGICGEASPRVSVTCQSALVFACRCLRAESFKHEGEASE